MCFIEERGKNDLFLGLMFVAQPCGLFKSRALGSKCWPEWALLPQPVAITADTGKAKTGVATPSCCIRVVSVAHATRRDSIHRPSFSAVGGWQRHKKQVSYALPAVASCFCMCSKREFYSTATPVSDVFGTAQSGFHPHTRHLGTGTDTGTSPLL